MNLLALKAVVKTCKESKNFNEKLHRDLFECYNESWMWSSLVSVADSELHIALLEYSILVLVSVEENTENLDIRNLSKVYEIFAKTFFKDEELFEGVQCADEHFLRVYKEKNGREFGK